MPPCFAIALYSVSWRSAVWRDRCGRLLHERRRLRQERKCAASHADIYPVSRKSKVSEMAGNQARAKGAKHVVDRGVRR